LYNLLVLILLEFLLGRKFSFLLHRRLVKRCLQRYHHRLRLNNQKIQVAHHHLLIQMLKLILLLVILKLASF
jgi:hypothetical protein